MALHRLSAWLKKHSLCYRLQSNFLLFFSTSICTARHYFVLIFSGHACCLKENLKKVAHIIAYHYENNRHHPEHFENGINDMTLVDLVEMFCDWKAATERHPSGNLLSSISINGKRFNMSAQLEQIFRNTAIAQMIGD